MKKNSRDGKPAIYKIVNTVNKKIYVGSCIAHYRRKAQHYYKLKNKVHDNNHLQSSWNKYGENNFKFIIIEFVEDTNKLIEREQHWIDILQSCNNKIGYNKNSIASSSLGYKMSKESKKKMSLAKKGIKPSKELATRRGLSCRKNINQYSKDGSFIKKFNGIIQASKELNISTTSISKCLSSNYKNNKTAGGFIWKYNNETL
jgi:hypothetical protein